MTTHALVQAQSKAHQNDLFLPEKVAADQKALYNALTNTDGLKAAIGKTLKLKGVIISRNRQFTDDETGEIQIRDVAYFITDKGNFATNSQGVLRDVEMLLQIFGHPDTWKSPLDIEVGQRKVKNGDMLTIKVA